MAIILGDNLKINVGAPIDSKYLSSSNAPYISVSNVNTTIPIAQRYVGLTVNVANVEYWYELDVNDGGLTIKSGGGTGSGERIEKTTTQTSHGFSVGDIVTYLGGTYIKAIADGTQDGEVIGFVSEVNTVDQFVVVYAGYVEGISALGLNPSTTYYLSTSVAGDVQSNNPTIYNTVSKPILITFDNNSALIYQYRGFVITSGSSGGGGITSGITDMSNVGGGPGEIFSTKVSTTSGETAELRTLVGSGNVTITTTGDTIIINSSGATGVYSGASPSNIEVGGVPIGTTLTGRTLEEIIEDILITVYTPTFTNPYNTFTLSGASNIEEVGLNFPIINFEATFNQGQIILEGFLQNPRAGLPNTYNYTGTGLPASTGSTSLNNVQQITNYVVQSGVNSWINTVSYDQGPQPYDSDDIAYALPLPANTTGPKSATITGIYPWFYGTVPSGYVPSGDNRPIADQALINSGSGNTVVGFSHATVIVNDFGATGDDYIWFAIPTGTIKTIWYVSESVKGLIGGVVSAGGNLFPDPVTVPTINSPSGLWSNISYDIYIANKQQAASYMEFKN